MRRHRNLIPVPTETDLDLRRFNHEDLSELDRESAWAELQQLARRLSKDLFYNRRPVVVGRRDGVLIDSVTWARERLQKLQPIASKRTP